MKISPLPINETERLDSLLSYQILDTLPENEFDQITFLASQISRCPVALVSLVDKNRQWFKSCFGIEAKETDRQISFCSYALHQKSPLIIPDATLDERFNDNPLVVNPPFVRFYAGFPLINDAGFCLGTLCVISTDPHELTEAEVKQLSILSNQVVKLMELRKANLKIKQDYEKISNLTIEHIAHKETLKKALIEKEAAAKVKTSFVANLSHEIRTPINGISGLLNLLEDSSLTSEQSDYVKTIKNSCESLLYIINDVLDFAKIESGKLNIESINIDFDNEMDYVSKSIRSSAEKKGIGFNFVNNIKLTHYLKGDPYRLKQIIFNLSSNAIKFTEKGFIELKLDSEKRDGKFILKASFSDSGIGMTKSQMAVLFKPFTQADSSTTRKFGGTGLGLSILKELIEMMKGKVSVESKEGVGSTFHFEIPFEVTSTLIQSQSSSRSTLSSLAKLPQQIKVLMAEDNLVNQKVQAATLKKLGYGVEIVENGLEVIKALKKESYDVILMDMQMPEMDGITCSKLLRSKGCETPIIALTANAIAEERMNCLDAGMNDFISKPFNIKILHDLIIKVVTEDVINNKAASN